MMIFLLFELKPEPEFCCDAAFNAAVTSAIDEPVTVPTLTTVLDRTVGIVVDPSAT